MVCLALELVGPWVVLGFSVGMEVFDELLLINMCLGVFHLVSLVWDSLGFLDLGGYFLQSFLPLAFNFILTIASRLLHPCSTDDKTSKLMVTTFSTVRDTQRGSQSYTEKI